jgi:hypothetical protein
MVPGHVAASDCERVRPGLVAQPANTASSLAFCVSGGWIWARSATTNTPQGWRAVAAAAVAVGLGSAAYHGPGGRWGRVVHDASNVLLGATVAGTLAAAGQPTRPALRYLSGLGAVAGLLVHRFSRTGRRLCRPDRALQGHAAWHLLAAASLVAAPEAHLPAGSPTSDPSRPSH